MKKYILQLSLLILTGAASFIYLSCDKFDTFALNIPTSVALHAEGSNSASNQTEEFCLNEDEQFQDYRDKIKKVTFIEAAWRTLNVSAGLQGSVSLTLSDEDGNLLFSKTLPGVNPAAYIPPNQPYIFTMSAAEIQTINIYLDRVFSQGNRNFCFQATAVTSSASGYVDGILDVVFEAETEF